MPQRDAPATAIAISALIFYSTLLQASPQDIVSIGGSSLVISATAIDFSSLSGPNAFDVGSASNGAYASLGGTAGSIQNVVLGSAPVANFLTIPSLPQAQFTLTTLAPGFLGPAGCTAAPPAPGEVCTPSGSPLNFINTETGSVASFSASGTVVNSKTGASTPFSAVFSTEFTGQSFQTILGTLATHGKLSAPYSASISIPNGSFAGTLAIGQPSLTSSATTISFKPSAVTVGPASTGAFTTLSGTTATFKDLTLGSGAVPNFLTLAALPQAEFTLNTLAAGILGDAGCAAAPPAVGQVCTPLGSPLNFVNTPDGTLMFYSAEGTATDSNTLLQTPFAGTYATEFAGESYQSVLGQLGTDGEVSDSYSVEIAAGPFSPTESVPETGSLALFGFGLAGLGFARRCTRGQSERPVP